MTVGSTVFNDALKEADFCLGDWIIKPELGDAIRGEVTIHLEPKVIAVLVCLSKRPGRLVAKSELLRAVWHDTFVTDDVLKRCIGELRRALGDDAREPRIIGTVPTRGYYLKMTPIDLHTVQSSNKEAFSVDVTNGAGRTSSYSVWQSKDIPT